MYFLVTIDVEEDNWGEYQPERVTVENIKKIPALQDLFEEFGIKPTYLITYPVATDPFSIELFSTYLDAGKCEIGMHCHPWNTPPVDEDINDFNSMLCNLPEALVLKKLTVLYETISQNFGIQPVSFRSGRWGFSPAVARALCKLGCRIDTSVSPFVDWSDCCGPDFSRFPLYPYRFNPEDIALPKESGSLLEIPATVGFLQDDFELCQRWTEHFESQLWRSLRIKGILGRLGLLNKVWFSPELSDAKSMIKLAKLLNGKDFPSLNMSFHSTTLKAGLTPFVTTGAAEESFLKRIEAVLMYAAEADFKFSTLDNAGSLSLISDSAKGYSRPAEIHLPCVGSP